MELCLPLHLACPYLFSLSHTYGLKPLPTLERIAHTASPLSRRMSVSPATRAIFDREAVQALACMPRGDFGGRESFFFFFFNSSIQMTFCRHWHPRTSGAYATLPSSIETYGVALCLWGKSVQPTEHAPKRVHKTGYFWSKFVCSPASDLLRWYAKGFFFFLLLLPPLLDPEEGARGPEPTPLHLPPVHQRPERPEDVLPLVQEK